MARAEIDSVAMASRRQLSRARQRAEAGSDARAAQNPQQHLRPLARRVRRERQQQRERPPRHSRHVAHGLHELEQKDGACGKQQRGREPGASRMQPRAQEVAAEHSDAAQQRHHEERRPFAAHRPRGRHRQRQSRRVGGHHFAGRWTRTVTERRKEPLRAAPWQQPGQRLVEGHARGGQQPRLAHVPRGVGGGGGERAEANARARGGRRDHDRDGRSMAIEAGAQARQRIGGGLASANYKGGSPCGCQDDERRGRAAGREMERSGVDDETAGDEDNDQHEQGARAKEHEKGNDAIGEPAGDAHSPSAAWAAASTPPSSPCRTQIGRSRSSCRRR